MLYGDEDTQGQETINALQDPRPVLTVSLDQLKNIQQMDMETTKRYSRVYFMDSNSYCMAARLNPAYKKTSPYTYWEVWDSTPPYQSGDKLSPKKDIWEGYREAPLVPWLPYITTAFLQSRPDNFLEYLRLIKSAENNPWVDYMHFGYISTDDAKKIGIGSGGNNIDTWVDKISGIVMRDIEYPFVSMYPHTITNSGEYDFSITTDRFKETVIQYALGDAFKIVDISRSTDPAFLEWAYKRVINRLPEIKTWINETSIVKVYRDGAIVKSVQVSLNPSFKTLLGQVADDTLVLIRQNMDKLAARSIEAQDAKSKGLELSFIGPAQMNPFLTANISNLKLDTTPVPDALTNVPSGVMDEVTIEKKKSSFVLPIAGAAVAAISIYAATR